MVSITSSNHLVTNNNNLLIITPTYPNLDDSYMGGTFIKNQVAELKRYFNKIVIIAPVLFSFNLMRKDKLCKNYNYENVDVYYPRCFYIPIFWLSKPLIDNRYRVVLRLINKKNIDFDLIHAHFTWPSGYIAVKLKKIFHKPVILTIHENGEWFDKEVSMNNQLINKAWTESDVLIRVNHKDVQTLNKFNSTVFTVYNGFSPNLHPIDMMSARKILGLPENSKIIFSLGNLIKRKGFNYLIEAMKIICAQRDDVICYIGGAGPERKKLMKQIRKLNMENNIYLLGSIPHDQLNIWMNSCDLFVLPSLSESFGVVLIEALACGKPVIAAMNRGSQEIILKNDFGFLVKPANPKDLAEKILMALDREWDSKKILDHASQFTWGNIGKQIIDIYEQKLEAGIHK